MTEIGFRCYSLPYTKELLRQKATECGLNWDKHALEAEAMIERFYSAGIFVVRALDDLNNQACMAAFMEKRSLDAGIEVSFDEDGNTKLVASERHKIRVMKQESVREIMRKDLGLKWVFAEAPLSKLLDHLYGCRLFVACADGENANRLRGQLAQIDLDDEIRGVDLRFRIH